MKISTLKLLILEFILITFLILNIFVINIINIYLLLGIIFGFIILVVLALGYEKNRQRFKKDIILNVIIYTLVFQIITYVLGIFIGFLRNGYSLSFIEISKNLIPMLFLIIICEILRYCINVKGQNNRLVIILSVLIFVLIDITVKVNIGTLSDKRAIMNIIFMTVLPSVSKNILLTYFSIKFGYNVNIVYRIIMELPVYFLPIFPNLNDYLNAILSLLFPIFIMYNTYKNMKNYSVEVEDTRDSKINRNLSILLTIFILLVVSLTSGLFPIYGIAVGSDSMNNTISKGDVVIVKKVKNKDINELNEGDILVYQYQKKVIVHRIVEKNKENENITFRTKGDNNDSIDSWIINQDDIIGKSLFKIRYIGYPTVWLNEMLK